MTSHPPAVASAHILQMSCLFSVGCLFVIGSLCLPAVRGGQEDSAEDAGADR